MIVSSFYEKAELEQFVRHEIETHDYAHCIDACWAPLLHAGLSVVLTDGNYCITLTLIDTNIVKAARRQWMRLAQCRKRRRAKKENF